MAGDIRRIQIFGERASGTNYLEHLARRNLPALSFTSDFAWKHFFPRPGARHAQDCLFLVIWRDPFDWLRSLYRHPWHTAPELRGLSFAEFIRHPWWCVFDEEAGRQPGDPEYGQEMMQERDPTTGERFANVLRLRAAKIRAFQELRASPHHWFVRYEELRADPKGAIRDLARQFGLRRRLWFRDVTTWKGGPDKFQPRRYEPIRGEDVEFLVSELDPSLEASIGYDVARRAAALRAGE